MWLAEDQEACHFRSLPYLCAVSLDNDYHVAAGLAMICSNVLEGYTTFNY
jgi:hypothetical protein